MIKQVFHLRINSCESNFSFVPWAVDCNEMRNLFDLHKEMSTRANLFLSGKPA